MFQIDEDVLLFLKGHLGNNDSEAFIRCSHFAYRDMCRTITFSPEYNENSAKSSEEKTKISEKKKELRTKVTELIKAQVEEWIQTPPETKEQFNEQHKKLCQSIIREYAYTTNQSMPKKSLYFGQAQKWVNMTLKNLYVYSKSNNTSLSLDHIIRYFHIPLDNVILDIASGKKKCYIPEGTKYHVKRPDGAWSKWSYKEYKAYQKQLEASIGGDVPIIWELRHWSTVER